MSVHGTALFFDALSLFFVFGSSIVFTLTSQRLGGVGRLCSRNRKE